MPKNLPTPIVQAPLDAGFRPLVLWHLAIQRDIFERGHGTRLVIGLDRGDAFSRFEVQVYPSDSPESAQNFAYIERLVKFLLWARGGFRIYIGGSRDIGEAVAEQYALAGVRDFDVRLMSRVYEHPFEVVVCEADEVPETRECALCVGGFLNGCRIGFDAGASDRKVAAVVAGTAVYSEEVVWDPRPQQNPQYHFDEIMTALKTAAAHMPRVDAIGVSSAGIYVNNRVRVASLFRGVPDSLFETRVRDLFLDIQREWNVPLEVVNDGDVTALAGAMSLNDTAVLGVALGSSEAAGYVNVEGKITGWLNELAFAPIDVNPQAPIDEWSCDIGCGVQYLSQQAVGRLIPLAGIEVPTGLGLPEQLKVVQSLMENGDTRARKIYETIGVYLGYALACYAQFYEMRHALILGRVTSGEGGQIILDGVHQVLSREFPTLATTLHVSLPDEENRRVGQAIAAASLPSLPGA